MNMLITITTPEEYVGAIVNHFHNIPGTEISTKMAVIGRR